jgi:hypothetical protein
MPISSTRPLARGTTFWRCIEIGFCRMAKSSSFGSTQRS